MTTSRIDASPSLDTTFADPVLAAEVELLRSSDRARDSAAAQRRLAQSARGAAENQQIREMRSAALARLIGGILQGVGQMAQGISSIVQGGHMAGAAGAPTNSAASQRASAAATQWGGAGQVAGASATLASTIAQNEASQADARAQQAANAARHAQDGMDEARDADQRLRGLQDRALDNMRAVIQADAQIRSTAIGAIRA